MSRFAFKLLSVVLSCSLPSIALAHGGAEVGGGFMHGLMHPASGLDHVCAMLAVGLWAAQMGGRQIWALPLSFVLLMGLGGALAAHGLVLPFVELGVLLSVLLLGMLVAAAIRLPLWLGSSLVGLFAVWHGYAHGAEMVESISGLTYASGFMLATALLHMSGIGFALAFALTIHGQLRETLVKLAGAVITVSGVYLSVS